jgi:hypothetical protein
LYAKETKAFGALIFCCEMGKASWCLPGSRDAPYRGHLRLRRVEP